MQKNTSLPPRAPGSDPHWASSANKCKHRLQQTNVFPGGVVASIVEIKKTKKKE